MFLTFHDLSKKNISFHFLWIQCECKSVYSIYGVIQNLGVSQKVAVFPSYKFREAQIVAFMLPELNTHYLMLSYLYHE